MASALHRLGSNFRDTLIKAAGIRLSDVGSRDTTDYAEIICGDGVPSGAYGRDSGATLLYFRKDASTIDTAMYISVNGGTAWNAVLTSTVADSELAAIAGLVSAADRLPYFTGAGTASLATFTSAGRALVDDADAAAQRTTLGLVIGTDVQAYDAELAAVAGLTSAANKGVRFTGSGTAELVDNVDAAATTGASTAAAGTTTSDAGALPAGTGRIYPTTAADGTKGVKLHTSDKVTGRIIFIGNGVSTATLKVYPPTGGTINGAAADAAFVSASGKGVIISCLSSGSNTWLAW